jgi:hypothetical protein
VQELRHFFQIAQGSSSKEKENKQVKNRYSHAFQ